MTDFMIITMQYVYIITTSNHIVNNIVPTFTCRMLIFKISSTFTCHMNAVE